MTKLARKLYQTSAVINMALAAVLFVGTQAQAATPFGTVIPNTATANYDVLGVPTSSVSAANITIGGRTPGTIEFLQYSPAGVSTPVPSNTEYSPSGAAAGPFVNLPAPTQLNGTPLVNSAPGEYKLAPGTIYARGEPVFVRVTDLDQNTTAGLDTVITTITAPNGETVTLRLTETGPNTGVFIGVIQSGRSAVVPNDNKLTLGVNTKATATYTDPLDGTGVASDIALFDPFGIVFDSSTGQPVNGARVELVRVDGTPFTVFCDDGVTVIPPVIISGAATACDPATAGAYRFPLIPVGDYKLLITPPAAYAFPSSVPDATLQLLPGGPRALQAGSRGGNFTLIAGPALQIDVPLDPSNKADLQIVKSANKQTVAIGDFMPYSISVKNNSAGAANNVVISDVLPLGMRYAKNSAKLEKIALAQNNPSIAGDGRTLKFNLGSIAAGASVTLNYVAEVTAGTPLGNATNIAFASSHSSNTGRASVKVEEELFRSRSLLAGRVILGCNAKVQDDIKGLQGARILLEDGTYLVTDKDGRWHADNIKPGTHVVQLDKDSLPANYEVISCEQNSRFAGRSYSQFVNIKGGTLWRADFYVQKIVDAKDDSTKPEALPSAGANQREFSLVEKLPYNGEWLATAAVGAEWLHPQSTFQPALPVIKVAVKSGVDDTVAVLVNGEKPDPLKYDGAQQNAAKTIKLSSWNALPIKDGDNTLQVTITDKDGKIVLQETRTIHYGVSIKKAVFDEKLSRLVADGKTKPVIAVRMLDEAGKPVRRGVVGEFEVNAPYQSQDQFEQIQREPLAAKAGSKAHFTIGADGIASIELMPTTQTGEVVLNFAFGGAVLNTQSQVANANNQVRAWLAPGQRDWVLVGFAEGTVGHKKLSGNMQALKGADADDTLFDQDRLAFYAKGSIKGEYLLTMAYDTDKYRGQERNSNLRQAVDPNQYYTLYADATQPQFDAASARKLYLKIEKAQFYAMFGDYDTALTLTELSRYSRTLNGVKSEYKGKQFSYSTFATQTAQAFKRDEIRGDGTSGLYKLSSGNMVINSDKVRIETRDRFRNEIIIKVENLTRYLDYDIDTDRGTLFFRQPIASKDANLNPTYIVVEYESNDKADEKMSYGGRAAYKPTANTELGVTHVHEGNVGNNGNLNGVDATYQVTDKTKLRAEVANSKREQSGTKSDGSAWLVEATHQDEKITARAYAREQETGFGLGQQSGGENGTRKMGVDGSYKLNENLQLQAEAYRQQTLASDAERNVAEGKAQWQKDNLALSGGLRAAEDKDDANTNTSKQATAGVAYSMFDKKLTLRANTELGLGSSESSDFPNRLSLGADYKLNTSTTLFGVQEFAKGDNIKANTTRVGMRTAPWQGGELAASLGNQIEQDSQRLFAAYGITQKWQLNQQWQLDAALDRSETLKNTATQLNNNVPLTSGGGLNGASLNTTDFTAVSLGAHFNDKLWSANSRVEYRTSDADDKINLLAGAQRNLDGGRSVAAGFIYNDVNGNGLDTTSLNVRLSAAYRPNDAAWIWLNRLDYIDESRKVDVSDVHTKKLVNNFNANYKPNRRTQLALQYGAKYVLDDIDGESYTGYTDLLGGELRYDITSKWDIGMHGSMLHSWNGGQKDYAYGASIGYNLMENTWVSVGYNVKGFADDDFSGAEYRTKGLFLNLRIKFDQDTLGLNKARNASTLQRP